MGMVILFLILLAFGLCYINKTNELFKKPTSEELESYQNAVFTHIDNEIESYEKKLKELYDKKGEPLDIELKKDIKILDEKTKELKDIEERIDKKIIKLNNYKDLLK